jgi:hypothetical protein
LGKFAKMRSFTSCNILARMGRERTHGGYSKENQKERDHSEDQGVGCWIILRRILERLDRVLWT